MVVSLLHSLFDFLAFKNGMYSTVYDDKQSLNIINNNKLLTHYFFLCLLLVRYSVLEQEQVHGRSISEICGSEFYMPTDCFPVPS